MKDIFERNTLLLGELKQKKLNESHVMIIGIGGVGSFVCESLARVGIGKITIIDKDVVDSTNINRQLIALYSTIGLPKVDVMENRINDINPDIQVIKKRITLDTENINEIFDEPCDFVVDAIDTISAKYSLIKYLVNNDIKFISVLGSGNKLNPTRFKVTDLKNTSYDPIAKILRNKVKRDRLKGKIPVVFSDEQPIKIEKKEDYSGKLIGSISFVPSVAGLIAASYCVNYLIDNIKIYNK